MLLFYIGIMIYLDIKNNDANTEKLNPRNQAVNEPLMINIYISFNCI